MLFVRPLGVLTVVLVVNGACMPKRGSGPATLVVVMVPSAAKAWVVPSGFCTVVGMLPSGCVRATGRR